MEQHVEARLLRGGIDQPVLHHVHHRVRVFRAEAVNGREDIVVTAGGVIPVNDYDFLYKAGVAAIFGPGTPVAYSAVELMKILLGEQA